VRPRRAIAATPGHVICRTLPLAPSLAGDALIARLKEICVDKRADCVVFAGDEPSARERVGISSALALIGVTTIDMPAIDAILQGNASIRERRFDLDDLMSRAAGELCPSSVGFSIEGRVIMVTGAGGSIGSALCRLLMGCAPKRLVLYEISEFALYSIEQELRQLRAETPGMASCEIIPVIASVCDARRLSRVMERYGVEAVYHAAAYKHVPLVESNLLEGLRNNVIGTACVAEAAHRCGVADMVLISTDKAVRPTSVMGASKRFAEIIVQDMQRRHAGTTYSMVRFGNVLGSSGSVVQLFLKQIAAGGPVTVTHPGMTRYFMTIPEAASLVLQAGGMAEGGDVFLLDMGEPVNILDLAQRMIILSGRRPVLPGQSGAGVQIVFTGMRHGEKLHEELLIDRSVLPSHHPRIARAREFCPPPDTVATFLRRIELAIADSDGAAAMAALRSAVPQYTPSDRFDDGAWTPYPVLDEAVGDGP
jgi:FlaA1/EpsC-like NDP-sugar epimerase